MLKRCCFGACTALLMLHLAPATAAEPPPAADEELVELDEVVVYGNDGKLVTGMQAESQLDAAGIASYGADTVGELLSQLTQDIDNTEEGPIILINGKPANGIRSVNDLPPESIANVQVLPPQAATALGYPATRRVVNVVMKQQFKTGVLNAQGRQATSGHAFNGTANVALVQLENGNFRNMALRVSHTASLLEAQRGVLSNAGILPYDLTGNVLAYPAPRGEIDPQLSALAGQTVTVLGLPVGVTDLTLGGLLPYANQANVSDLGRYRTLLADQYTYGVNMNLSRQLPWRSGFNINFNADRTESQGLTGAAPALLRLPETSPYSPFSRDVNIARYLGEPLRQEQKPTQVNFFGNLFTQQGKWRLALDTSFNWRSSITTSERRFDTAAVQAAINTGALNPFDEIPADLLGEVLSDRATSHGYNSQAQLQASRSILTLPTGTVNTVLRAEWRRSEQHSRNSGSSLLDADRHRDDQVAYGSLQVPLFGSRETPSKWSVGAEVTGAAREVSAIGTLYDRSAGLNWRVGNRLTLGATLSRQEVAPQPEQLNTPTVTLDGYRVYDFIRDETVLVRYITGGNPDLQVEDRRVTRITATWRPFAQRDLNFNADYQRTIGHDAAAPLPPVSGDVQAAFPDRYLRDAQGQLFQIDARTVSFERTQNEQIRWGGNYRGVLGKAPPPAANSGAPRIMFGDESPDLGGAGWRLSGNFNHTWLLSSRRLARTGLPEVDLLSGGTAGYNAASRHVVQARLGLAHNGTGLQLNTNWRSAARITGGTVSAPNDIQFDAFLRLDVSAFTNLDTVFPGSALAKGMRVSLGVDNILDEKQRVQDANGNTPLRYQAYLLNPAGRVIGISLRKNL
jgi:hypothetical protein